MMAWILSLTYPTPNLDISGRCRHDLTKGSRFGRKGKKETKLERGRGSALVLKAKSNMHKKKLHSPLVYLTYGSFVLENIKVKINHFTLLVKINHFTLLYDILAWMKGMGRSHSLFELSYFFTFPSH